MNTTVKHLAALMGGLCCLSLAAGSASALTDTANFNAQIVIAAECAIQSATTLDFGTAGALDATIDASSAITVKCTNGTTYSVGLNGGSGGGNTTTRTMENGAEDVAYTMSQNAARTVNWGNVLADWVSGTGNGNDQVYTVYGRVAAQTAPTPATYLDTVTVTVTY